ncbi:MAG: PIN domain-containing protein [Desulfovibrionales bacterium]|nr:PIN domain-containing protein [Desulfovibrionales bacterium]
MIRPSVSRKLMIMDACVLIDFIKTERTVLELVSKHIGPLYVTSPVVDEVKEIDNENELIALGLIIIEPEIEDAYVASSRFGPLSLEDWLCLLTAKRHGFTCVTNDKNLRKLCQQEEVSLLWGLELVAELYKVGGITHQEASIFAQSIRQSNPKHITEEIISRFMDLIRR